jgi:hypothetical protein
MRNTADVTGGKPIDVLLQSISGVSAINPLVAFYNIHGGKREVLFFYFVPDTTRDTMLRSRKYCFIVCLRSSMAPRKLSNVGQSLDGWPKIYYLELLRASEGTSSRWSRLHLQSLAPTNPHWAHVVGYGLFSLSIIHKEGLCPSSGDINGLIMCV